jgi:TATA-binding protein-associated factor
MAEWQAAKSTKMDVCAQICQYYLSQDDAPDVEFENGEPVFPTLPPLIEGILPTRNTKVLIYAEFPSMTGLLMNVCPFFVQFFFH